MASILDNQRAVRSGLVAAGVPECDLDDLHQEVALALWKLRAPSIAPGLAWVIAWRIGYGWRVRASTRERLNTVPLDRAEQHADDWQRIEARDRLRRALAKVSAYDRVLLAGIAEGASVVDMCKRLSLPRVTADRRLSRVRRRLLRK